MSARTRPKRPGAPDRFTVSELHDRWDGEFTTQGIRWLIQTGRLKGARLKRDKRRPYVVKVEDAVAFESSHPRLRELAERRNAS